MVKGRRIGDNDLIIFVLSTKQSRVLYIPMNPDKTESVDRHRTAPVNYFKNKINLILSSSVDQHYCD